MGKWVIRRMSELKHHKIIYSEWERDLKEIACVWAYSASKNIHSFDTHLRRISTIWTILYLLGLCRSVFSVLLYIFSSYMRDSISTFPIFLSHKDKMFFELQTTFHLIVRQPTSQPASNLNGSILLWFRSTIIFFLESEQTSVLACIHVRKPPSII